MTSLETSQTFLEAFPATALNWEQTRDIIGVNRFKFALCGVHPYDVVSPTEVLPLADVVQEIVGLQPTLLGPDNTYRAIAQRLIAHCEQVDPSATPAVKACAEDWVTAKYAETVNG